MSESYEISKEYNAMYGRIVQDLDEISFQVPDDMILTEIASDIAGIMTSDMDNVTSREIASQGLQQIKELIAHQKLPINADWYQDLLRRVSLLETPSDLSSRIEQK